MSCKYDGLDMTAVFPAVIYTLLLVLIFRA